MDRMQRIAEVEGELQRLEALRGTPEEPVALDAQLGQLRRTLTWHRNRLDPAHPNTGKVSLYERSGAAKRGRRRFEPARDYPTVSLGA